MSVVHEGDAAFAAQAAAEGVEGDFLFARRLSRVDLERVFDLLPRSGEGFEVHVYLPRGGSVVVANLSDALSRWDEGASQISLRNVADTGVTQVIAIDWRTGGRLGIFAKNPSWDLKQFTACRHYFDRVVADLDPYQARMGLGKMVSLGMWAIGSVTTRTESQYVAGHYDWLQAFSPGTFVDRSVEGIEIQSVGSNVVLALGPTPVQPLAARDAMRTALLSGLPVGERKIDDRGLLADWHRAALLASAEGGCELTPTLLPLTGLGSDSA